MTEIKIFIYFISKIYLKLLNEYNKGKFRSILHIIGSNVCTLYAFFFILYNYYIFYSKLFLKMYGSLYFFFVTVREFVYWHIHEIRKYHISLIQIPKNSN